MGGAGNLVVPEDVATILWNPVAIADVGHQGRGLAVHGIGEPVFRVLHIPFVLDANGVQVVIPVSGMPRDVRLVDHLGDLAV